MIQEQSNMCVFVCVIPQLLCRNKMRFELKSTLLKYLVSCTLFFTFAKRLTTLSEQYHAHCSFKERAFKCTGTKQNQRGKSCGTCENDLKGKVWVGKVWVCCRRKNWEVLEIYWVTVKCAGFEGNLGRNPFPIWTIEPFPGTKPQAQLLKRTKDKSWPSSRELGIHAYQVSISQKSQLKLPISMSIWHSWIWLISAQLQV